MEMSGELCLQLRMRDIARRTIAGDLTRYNKVNLTVNLAFAPGHGSATLNQAQ